MVDAHLAGTREFQGALQKTFDGTNTETQAAASRRAQQLSGGLTKAAAAHSAVVAPAGTSDYVHGLASMQVNISGYIQIYDGYGSPTTKVAFQSGQGAHQVTASIIDANTIRFTNGGAQNRGVEVLVSKTD